MKLDQEHRRRSEEAQIDNLSHERAGQKRLIDRKRDETDAFREKDTFQALLRDTESKIRTMEKGKFEQFRNQLKREIEDTENQRKIEYDRRMREMRIE